MEIESTMPSLFPTDWTDATRPLVLNRSAEAIHDELSAFDRDLRAQAAGLDFEKRSLAGDILSIFAAGAIVERLGRHELTYAASLRALRRVLRELYGWNKREAADRARALLWAARHGDSLLADAVRRGAEAFRAWRGDRGQLSADAFRAVYRSLTGA